MAKTRRRSSTGMNSTRPDRKYGNRGNARGKQTRKSAPRRKS